MISFGDLGGGFVSTVKAVDYNSLARDYAIHRGANPAVLASLVARIHGASDVLEIGSGTGNYIGAIAEQFGCTCTAVEPSEEMAAKARARHRAVTVLCEAAERLSLPDDRFDLAFSVDVVHHLTDRSSALREASRVVRPGGSVCTVTDSEWIIRKREPLAEYFPETVEVELARYPRIEQLRVEKHQCGLVNIREALVEHRYEVTSAAPYEARVFSSLLYISDDAHQRGVAKLQSRLRQGPLPCTSRYLMLWGDNPS